MSNPRAPGSRQVDQSAGRIRSLVECVETLSRRTLPPDDFHAEFLAHAVRALGAVGGAVWMPERDGRQRLSAQLNMARSTLDLPGEHQARHARLVAHVARKCRALVVPPHAGAEGARGGNPTELLLLLAPVRVGRNVVAVVEVFQRPGARRDAWPGFLRFIVRLCRLAGDFHAEWLLCQLQSRGRRGQFVEEFAAAVHQSLDLPATAATMVNEVRRMLPADRVSIAVRQRGHYAIEAISGQPRVEPRANVTRHLAALAKVAADERTGTLTWKAGQEPTAWPQRAAAALDAYRQLAEPQALIVLSLDSTAARQPDTSPTKGVAGSTAPLAVMIIEQYGTPPESADAAGRLEIVRSQGALAIARASEHAAIPGRALWSAAHAAKLSVAAGRVPRPLRWLGALAAMAALLVVIPAPFELEGRGALQPTKQRHLFADVNGTVEHLHVKHGEQVAAGQVLLTLRNPDLELQRADVAGRRRAAEQQLAALRRQRHKPHATPAERAKLAGEIQAAVERLKSLEEQQSLLETEHRRLELRSPLAGEVATWDPDYLLAGRPVAPGQKLLTIIDSQAAWQLEVHLPENRVGHVVAARSQSEAPLEVSYVLASDPARRLAGKLETLDATAELHEEHGHTVKLVVAIDRHDLREPRAGATAVARVHCGERALGYVWLHELFDFVESRVFFGWTSPASSDQPSINAE